MTTPNSRPRQRTVYNPVALHEQMQRYLQEHPGESYGSVVRRCLAEYLREQGYDIEPLE